MTGIPSGNLLVLSAFFVACQTQNKGVAQSQEPAALYARMDREDLSPSLREGDTLPLSFTYREDFTYTGDTTSVRISGNRDTLRFTYLSAVDGGYPSLGIENYKDFRVIRTGMGRYVLEGNFMFPDTDVMEISIAPKAYSLSLLAISDDPLPPGEYRISLSKVWPKWSGRAKAYDAKGNLVYQDPEYTVEETWVGSLRIP